MRCEQSTVRSLRVRNRKQCQTQQAAGNGEPVREQRNVREKTIYTGRPRI